jgi:hypothetical protein
MQVILDRAILEHLLERAATASRLLGHADEHTSATLVEAAADTVDEIAHVLGELLGNTHVVIALRSRVGAACTVDAAAHDNDGAQVDGVTVVTPCRFRCGGAGAVSAEPTTTAVSAFASRAGGVR